MVLTPSTINSTALSISSLLTVRGGISLMALGLTGFKSKPNSLQVDTSSGAMSSVNSTAISNPLPRISLILGRESVAFQVSLLDIHH